MSPETPEWLWKRGENPVVYLSTEAAISLSTWDLPFEDAEASR